MPLLRDDAVVLSFLLLCVPIQYFFVKHWGGSGGSRSYALKQLIQNLVKFQSEYLEWESWKKWCYMLMSIDDTPTEDEQPFISLYPMDLDDPEGESPAVEVMKYKQKEGFFALSQEPRLNRSPSVRYKVGQVVVHKYKKYRGVIIGWDETAKAPEEWLKAMHGDEYRWRNMPNYAVLVDMRDRLTPQITYVPEDNITVLPNAKILHPLLDDHFESFDGSQYIPRPWLKVIYPQG